MTSFGFRNVSRRYTEASRRMKASLRRAALHYDTKAVVRTHLRRWRNW